MMYVWPCVANTATILGPKLSKQESIFRRFSINMGGWLKFIKKTLRNG